MMARNLALAALLLVAACGKHEGHTATTNDSSAAKTSSAAADSVPSLEGQWQVVSIGGRPLSAGAALAVSFAGGKASISSGCVRRGLIYTQKRNGVSFAIDPRGSANCEGRGTSADHETAYAAIQHATMAIFSQKGARADLSGAGGTLALERR
jgi:hypothetical protein